MKLQVTHRTRYAYAAPVRDSFNEVHLQPADTTRQRRLAFRLSVQPTTRLASRLDFYLNTVHTFEVAAPHAELVVEAHSEVETCDTPALDATATPRPLAALGDCARFADCYDFLQPSTFVDVGGDLTTLAREIVGAQTDAWQAALAIMHFIHGGFRYQPAVTTAHTHMREALRLRCGVCQDFAHVMLGLCRTLGLPARYVSGYLYNGPADQLKGAQASHAWVEVFLPGHGWLGLDPTNDQIVAGRHIHIATGRDYADVSPVKGTYRGTTQRQLHVDVLVSLLGP